MFKHSSAPDLLLIIRPPTHHRESTTTTSKGCTFSKVILELMDDWLGIGALWRHPFYPSDYNVESPLINYRLARSSHHYQPTHWPRSKPPAAAGPDWLIHHEPIAEETFVSMLLVPHCCCCCCFCLMIIMLFCVVIGYQWFLAAHSSRQGHCNQQGYYILNT